MPTRWLKVWDYPEIGNIFPKGYRVARYVIIVPHAESDQRRSFRDKTETMLSIRTHLRIEGIRGLPLHHTLLASNTHDQSENFADFQKCNRRILDPSSVFLGPETIAGLEREEKWSRHVSVRSISLSPSPRARRASYTAINLLALAI